MSDLLDQAARLVRDADTIIITAGSGMGVDSGLATYRGPEKRIDAIYERRGLTYSKLASGRFFLEDPATAWGFYGGALEAFRSAKPHGGYGVLRRWDAAKRERGWVLTSNVDGYFQRAGYDRRVVVEVHGSFLQLQCTRWCGVGVFDAKELALDIDPETLAARTLPSCPSCGSLARPNALMFADADWDDTSEAAQYTELEDWLDSLRDRGLSATIIECGAGTTVPTVRRFTDRVNEMFGGGRLVRLNVHESTVAGDGSVGLAMGCREALEAIDERIGGWTNR